MSIKCEKEKYLNVCLLINLSRDYFKHVANGLRGIYTIKKKTIHLLKQLNIKDYRSKHGT
jgi:hypothetical protein